MGLGKYLSENNKYIKIVLTVAVITTAIGAIISFANSYPNWIKPKVKVLEVDFENGIAKIEINGKVKELIGDSVLTAGGDWGVKFGYASTTDDYNTVEVTKNGMVYQIISKREAL